MITWRKKKLDDLSKADNELDEKFIKLEEENRKLWHKVADLEDRSRRNNARFRGVQESVEANKIVEYITTLCTILLPSMDKSCWGIERAHRLPKPARFTLDIPRDIIVCFYRYTEKEALFSAIRKISILPIPYEAVTVYTDLSLCFQYNAATERLKVWEPLELYTGELLQWEAVCGVKRPIAA
ncbi:Hypothetical predicted protein [Pelobates cultripes]|uniref:Uncharacterized protein n=1 Tax=Pelobates cultripes TaxID=61616 RepID=A0AAD1SAC1_PELCU|nr:Hypothetical predicted protein [Pelobates cultripes]